MEIAFKNNKYKYILKKYKFIDLVLKQKKKDTLYFNKRLDNYKTVSVNIKLTEALKIEEKNILKDILKGKHFRILYNFFCIFLQDILIKRFGFFFVIRLTLSIIFILPQFFFIYLISKTNLVQNYNFIQYRSQLSLGEDKNILKSMTYISKCKENLEKKYGEGVLDNCNFAIKEEFLNNLSRFNDNNLKDVLYDYNALLTAIYDHNKDLCNDLKDNRNQENINVHAQIHKFHSFLKTLKSTDLLTLNELKEEICVLKKYFQSELIKISLYKKLKNSNNLILQNKQNIKKSLLNNSLNFKKILDDNIYNLYSYYLFFLNDFDDKISYYDFYLLTLINKNKQMLSNDNQNIEFSFYDSLNQIYYMVNEKIQMFFNFFSYLCLGFHKKINHALIMHVANNVLLDYKNVSLLQYLLYVEYYLKRIIQYSFCTNVFFGFWIFNDVLIKLDFNSISRYFIADWTFSYLKPFYIFFIRILMINSLNFIYSIFISLGLLLYFIITGYHNFLFFAKFDEFSFLDKNNAKKIKDILLTRYSVYNNISPDKFSDKYKSLLNINSLNLNFFCKLFYFILISIFIIFIFSLIDVFTCAFTICYEYLFYYNVVYHIFKYLYYFSLFFNRNFFLSFSDIFSSSSLRCFFLTDILITNNVFVTIILFLIFFYLIFYIKYFYCYLILNILLIKLNIILFNKFLIYGCISFYNILALLIGISIYFFFIESFFFEDVMKTFGNCCKLV